MPDIPAGLDWTVVVGAVSEFIGNTLVIGGIAAVLALRFLPGFLRALRSIISRS